MFVFCVYVVCVFVSKEARKYVISRHVVSRHLRSCHITFPLRHTTINHIYVINHIRSHYIAPHDLYYLYYIPTSTIHEGLVFLFCKA